MQQGPQRAQRSVMKSVMQYALEQKQLCPNNPGGRKGHLYKDRDTQNPCKISKNPSIHSKLAIIILMSWLVILKSICFNGVIY